MYVKYNDYELLYLIEEGSEEAYQALFEKYDFLIRQKISDFRVKQKYVDDFYQEGFIVLENAIRNFDEYKGKTFTNFFTMLLEYRYQRLLAIEKNFFYHVTLFEFPELIEDKTGYYEDDHFSIENNLSLSDLELDCLFLISKGYKPREIASKRNLNVRAIYNAIGRIKVKVKNYQKATHENLVDW